MSPVVDVAARHSVLLWEDCAQVFTGRQGYLGHPQSDATFFSFGVIKRATALGGGIARIADRSILSGVVVCHSVGPAFYLLVVNVRYCWRTSEHIDFM